MVIRWLASSFIRTEKRFNKIMGYRNLWALEPSSTTHSLPPGRLPRSIINPTAVGNFQLRAGTAQCLPYLWVIERALPGIFTGIDAQKRTAK
jgi:hypothetical protein